MIHRQFLHDFFMCIASEGVKFISKNWYRDCNEKFYLNESFWDVQ